MKTLYFDCFSGFTPLLSLGALLNSGNYEQYLRQELSSYKLGDFTLNITLDYEPYYTTRVEVLALDDHHNRPVSFFISKIEELNLKPYTKQLSLETFLRLARAMSTIYGIPADKIYLPRSGSLLISLVSLSIILEKISPDQILFSPLPLGFGQIKINASMLPIPTPVTAELLKGLPVTLGSINSELVTEAGASLSTVLANKFCSSPETLTTQSVGYGKRLLSDGSYQFIRAIIGNQLVSTSSSNAVIMIETNIDDMNPEYYPYIIERLFSLGALDAFLTPIIMKKGRPGIKLSVLCPPGDTKPYTKLILQETSTLGVRISYLNREVLHRDIIKLATPYGTIRVKVGRMLPGEQAISIAPEFEDCKVSAISYGVPINEVYMAALSAAKSLLTEKELA